jgi:hypothetical protein
MLIQIEISNPPQWRPGHFESRVTSRYWWLWFAVARIKVPPLEYATTAWDWQDR